MFSVVSPAQEEENQRHPVPAQQGNSQYSGSCHLQQAVPDGLDETRAQQKLHREEVNQRTVTQKPPQQYWKIAGAPNQ